MKELPETDDAVAQWCRDLFVAKVHTVEIVTGLCYKVFESLHVRNFKHIFSEIGP